METFMTVEYDLIERSKRDPEAFRELYRRYFPRVYAYVAYRLPSRADAEDVVSETFEKVVEELHRFVYRGEGSFAAWVFRIAYNQVNQFYRRTQRYTPISLDDLPDVPSTRLSPDGVVQQREQFGRLAALIATLPPRRQEIVTLRFFGGLRNQEIAQVLGLDERTVASHLSRALDDLRRKYQPEFESQP
jgi:RNA polymerase sigma-70 factor (ECF subfamily)